MIDYTELDFSTINNYHKSILQYRRLLNTYSKIKLDHTTPSVYLNDELTLRAYYWQNRMIETIGADAFDDIIKAGFISFIEDIGVFDIYINRVGYVYLDLKDAKHNSASSCFIYPSVLNEEVFLNMNFSTGTDSHMLVVTRDGRTTPKAKYANELLREGNSGYAKMVDTNNEISVYAMTIISYIQYNKLIGFKGQQRKKCGRRNKPSSIPDINKPFIVVYLTSEIKKHLQGTTGSITSKDTPSARRIHKRKAHTRTLRADRFKNHPLYMIPDAIEIAESWSGTVDVEDTHYIYKLRK